MPVHVKAFGPERALGYIIDIPLENDIDGLTFFSIKR
jgi:hypothetical protein